VVGPGRKRSPDANAAVQKILDVPVKDLLKKQFRSAWNVIPHLIENLDKNETGNLKYVWMKPQAKNMFRSAVL
jgi:hypothetical protein